MHGFVKAVACSFSAENVVHLHGSTADRTTICSSLDALFSRRNVNENPNPHHLTISPEVSNTSHRNERESLVQPYCSSDSVSASVLETILEKRIYQFIARGGTRWKVLGHHCSFHAFCLLSFYFEQIKTEQRNPLHPFERSTGSQEMLTCHSRRSDQTVTQIFIRSSLQNRNLDPELNRNCQTVPF